MPTTITSSNGRTFHLWQLPDRSAPEPEDSTELTVIDNELQDGYYFHSLFGQNTGVREWSLTLPTLMSTTFMPANVTDPYGATVTREQYIRNLYQYNQVTGLPFAYPDPNTGQYYLVDIISDELEMTRFDTRVKLYSADITLRQRRIKDVTIFDVSKVPATSGGYNWYDNRSQGSGVWADWGNSNTLTASGDVVMLSNTLNGLATVRLNGSSTTGQLSGTSGILPAFEAFMMVKIREATFSALESVMTVGSTDVIRGQSGTATFRIAAPTTAKDYYLSGTRYATGANRPAPMNVWGVVQIRDSNGWGFTGTTLKLGISKADIAEVIQLRNPTMLKDAREIIEYLAIKWGQAA